MVNTLVGRVKGHIHTYCFFKKKLCLLKIMFPTLIQVLSPGDVAFTLGQGNDTTIISNTAEWDPNNICMSLSSLVGGLVLLVGKLIKIQNLKIIKHKFSQP